MALLLAIIVFARGLPKHTLADLCSLRRPAPSDKRWRLPRNGLSARGPVAPFAKPAAVFGRTGEGRARRRADKLRAWLAMEYAHRRPSNADSLAATLNDDPERAHQRLKRRQIVHRKRREDLLDVRGRRPDLIGMGWRQHELDGGILRFHRETRSNILIRAPETALATRKAPRVLQVALTSQCNLACAFCYRDRAVPDLFDTRELTELLKKASSWGVLEVAFGGGEPLMFRGFVDLLTELHNKTPLGLGFTTNGVLLDEETIARVRGIVSEVRISAYGDNHFRSTLRRCAGLNVGVNIIVTPRNLSFVEPLVFDALSRGAQNVLLLGYKGIDSTMRLSPSDFATLTQTICRLEGLPIRVDACWYPNLPDVPHLFERRDCGAGDEFLAVTCDRRIRPCSFAPVGVSFETFEDLVSEYQRLRTLRPVPRVDGCARSHFSDAGPYPFASERSAWIWQASAGNNSGDWTIVARFCDTERARHAADALRDLARAHEAFLASPEGHSWLELNGYNGSIPSPPLVAFGRAHGFDWSQEGYGLWWEEDGCGAPVLSAGLVGDAVVVYHPYCMGLPEDPFKDFFSLVGATEFLAWQYQRPRVIITASGRNAVAETALDEHLTLVRAAEYPSYVATPPPWGSDCPVGVLFDDEDRSARLGTGLHAYEATATGIRVALAFENTLAGAIAFEGWLRDSGFADIALTVEGVLEAISQPSDDAARSPVAGLFGDQRALSVRLTGADAETVMDWLFKAGRLSEHFKDALERIDKEEVARLGVRHSREYWKRGLAITGVCVDVLTWLGPEPGASNWARLLWAHLREADSPATGRAVAALAATLPADEAFGLARAWYEQAPDHRVAIERLQAFRVLQDIRTADLVAEALSNSSAEPLSVDSWSHFVAESGITWKVARSWLALGRPLSLIALGALNEYCDRGAPLHFGKPRESELKLVLEAYRDADPVPRVRKTTAHILQYPTAIVCDAEGI